MTVSEHGMITAQQHQPLQTADINSGPALYYEPDGIPLIFAQVTPAMAPATHYDVWGDLPGLPGVLGVSPTPFPVAQSSGGSAPFTIDGQGTGSVQWTNLQAAVDGNLNKPYASCALNGGSGTPANNGMANFIHAHFSPPVALTGVRIVGPNDDGFRGDESTILFTVSYSDDGGTTKVQVLSQTLGDAPPYPLNLLLPFNEPNPHSDWYFGWAGDGIHGVKVCQLIPQQAGPPPPPFDRGLVYLTDGSDEQTNDAALTVGTMNGPVSLPAASGAKWLGTFKTDPTTLSITAHILDGLARVFNYWNARNRVRRELKVFDTSGPINGRYSYTPAVLSPMPPYPVGPSHGRTDLSASIVIGQAISGSEIDGEYAQSAFLNASASRSAYWFGIEFAVNGQTKTNEYGNTISGDMVSMTIDTTGQEMGPPPGVAIATTDLCQGTVTASMKEGASSSDVSAFFNPRNQYMTLSWEA